MSYKIFVFHDREFTGGTTLGEFTSGMMLGEFNGSITLGKEFTGSKTRVYWLHNTWGVDWWHMTLGKTTFKFTSDTTLEFTSDTTLEEFTSSTTFGDANPCTSAFFNLVNMNESALFNSSKLLFTFIVLPHFFCKNGRFEELGIKLCRQCIIQHL